MRTILLIAAAAIVSPTISQAQEKQPAKGDHDIVVTGQRLSDTEAALKACIRQHCPPDQDIAATLTHAENQFVAGNYKDARDTLNASLGRNKRFGKKYPVPVASLWRAQSKISIHLGESDTSRVNEIESLDVLRNGLGPDDPRTLAQRIEVADTFAHLGRAEGALAMYRDVAHRARAIGDFKMEGQALFHAAMLNSVLADINPAIYREEAKRSIARIVNTTEPALAPFRDAANLIKLRLEAKDGDPASVDKVIASYHSSGTLTPTLLYAPLINRNESERAFQTGGETGKLAVGSYDDQWVDIGFWVTPTGTVSDASIVRGAPKLYKPWVEPILKSIGERRYAPLAMDKNDPGLFRVERYSLTAHWIEGTGTHLRVREAYPRIEILDLTADPAPKKSTALSGG